MIGSTRLAQTALLCSTPKARLSAVISRISFTCGTPALRKMKKSVLVQTRDHDKKPPTRVRTNTASFIALAMSAGRERTKISFASRLRLKLECKENNHEINYQSRDFNSVERRAYQHGESSTP